MCKLDHSNAGILLVLKVIIYTKTIISRAEFHKNPISCILSILVQFKIHAFSPPNIASDNDDMYSFKPHLAVYAPELTLVSIAKDCSSNFVVQSLVLVYV